MERMSEGVSTSDFINEKERESKQAKQQLWKDNWKIVEINTSPAEDFRSSVTLSPSKQ